MRIDVRRQTGPAPTGLRIRAAVIQSRRIMAIAPLRCVSRLAGGLSLAAAAALAVAPAVLLAQAGQSTVASRGTLGSPLPPPLPADAPFTVAMNSTTIEGAPVYVAANGPLRGRLRIVTGGVRNLANGSAHVATNAETQYLFAGAPNVRFLMTVAEGLYRVVARRSAGIASPVDLRGKRIAIPRDTSAHYYLVRTLSGAGLREEDVTLVDDLPRDQMASGLAAGRVDALVMWEPEAEKAVAALGRDVAIFQDNRRYRELFSLYTTTDVLKQPRRRREVLAFVRALLEAADAMKREPNAQFPIVAAQVGQTVEWVSRSWKHHAFPMRLLPDLLDVMVEEDRWVAARQQRTPRSRATLERAIDPGVLSEALAPAPAR